MENFINYLKITFWGSETRKCLFENYLS